MRPKVLGLVVVDLDPGPAAARVWFITGSDIRSDGCEFCGQKSNGAAEEMEMEMEMEKLSLEADAVPQGFILFPYSLNLWHRFANSLSATHNGPPTWRGRVIRNSYIFISSHMSRIRILCMFTAFLIFTYIDRIYSLKDKISSPAHILGVLSLTSIFSISRYRHFSLETKKKENSERNISYTKGE